MAPASCALLSDVPIARYRECFKSLIAFNPDEPQAGSMASPLQTHTDARPHKSQPHAPTRSPAILVWRLKPYKRGETKVKPPSFKWREHGLTKWAGELRENKRRGRGSVWRKQRLGQHGWGAGPLIKRIIWRRTARGRGCPCSEMEYSNETHHWQLRESKREKDKTRAKVQRWKEGTRLDWRQRKESKLELMRQWNNGFICRVGNLRCWGVEYDGGAPSIPSDFL